jgi:uncharacterized protein YbaR (Trm112 family)
MIFDANVLQMIRCPVSHSRLSPMDDSGIERLNQKIANGEVFDRLGRAIKDPLESGLINEEAKLVMPVRGGIITLIADEAIVLGDSVD